MLTIMPTSPAASPSPPSPPSTIGWSILPRADSATKPPSSSHTRAAVRLPNEIIALTAEWLVLAGQCKSSANLLRANRALFRRVVPHLYHVVKLASNQAILAFYENMFKWTEMQKQVGHRPVGESIRPNRRCSMVTQQYDPVNRIQQYTSAIRHVEIELNIGQIWGWAEHHRSFKLNKKVRKLKPKLLLDSLVIKSDSLDNGYYGNVWTEAVVSMWRARHIRWSASDDLYSDELPYYGEIRWPSKSRMTEITHSWLIKWLSNTWLESFDLPAASAELAPVLHKGRWLVFNDPDRVCNENLFANVASSLDVPGHRQGPQWIIYNADEEAKLEAEKNIKLALKDISSKVEQRVQKHVSFLQDKDMSISSVGPGEIWRRWLKKDVWVESGSDGVGVATDIGGAKEVRVG